MNEQQDQFIPKIQKGSFIAFFAFDIGHEILLEKIETILSSFPVKIASKKKQTPNYLQYTESPQVIFLGDTDILTDIPGQIYATFFDFGAVSISYRWPLNLPLDALPSFSQKIFETALEEDARQRLEGIFEKIRPTVIRPELAQFTEDYFIFILEELDHTLCAIELLRNYPSILAQVLRFDTAPLSQEEREEALSRPISYYERDLVLVDWNAAIVYDPDFADTVNVLELLNVELLETRYLDAQLDKRIKAYEGLLEKQPRWFLPLYSPYRQSIKELAELRIESSLLAERVDNALKLIGDLYLARLYSTVSERFNLPAWDASISKKLDIIGSLYQLLTDRLNTAQAQTLELIIILLILIEILLRFSNP